jgi:hypothetical protein
MAWKERIPYLIVESDSEILINITYNGWFILRIMVNITENDSEILINIPQRIPQLKILETKLMLDSRIIWNDIV